MIPVCKSIRKIKIPETESNNHPELSKVLMIHREKKISLDETATNAEAVNPDLNTDGKGN